MKKLFYIVIIIVGILIINNLVRSIYGLWQKRSLIEDAKKELSIEKRKYVELGDEMKEVGKASFLEEEARNKLFLVKPGEEVVIVPREVGEVIKSTRKMRVKAVWQQWFVYFGFGT